MLPRTSGLRAASRRAQRQSWMRFPIGSQRGIAETCEALHIGRSSPGANSNWQSQFVDAIIEHRSEHFVNQIPAFFGEDLSTPPSPG